MDVSLTHFDENISTDIIRYPFLLGIYKEDSFAFEYMFVVSLKVVILAFQRRFFTFIPAIDMFLHFSPNKRFVVRMDRAIVAKLAEFVFHGHHLLHKMGAAENIDSWRFLSFLH